MTIKELIDVLSKMPPNVEVVIFNEDGLQDEFDVELFYGGTTCIITPYSYD
jgi:hypothetical protein